eukprot:TRINITY_DN13302_c0_g1_i1.p1 TRINITY_DN13302_c0_g1~~TRINITY_DN13302_c0_g1_i1.p1  ORF type:complete len:340 (+),score=66.21 TRINITY_DN13302_c0_g1_i1:58-1020(+)
MSAIEALGHLTKSYVAIAHNPSLLLNADFLLASDPIVVAVLLCVFFVLFTYIMSLFTGNWSQVDRLWSITPIVYTGWFALSANLPLDWTRFPAPLSLRNIIIAALAFIWGCRLTYNFWRKGGYQAGSEDHRWPVLRTILPGWTFQIFNFFFVSLYQNILLLLISIPAYVCAVAARKGTAPPVSVVDYALAGAFLALLLGEVVADQQQWRFQTAKYKLINAKKPLTGEYANGFITTGLFSLSRHPNFFCEFSMWWVIAAFAVCAQGGEAAWTILGAGLLTMLFQGSTQFTEYITAQKYKQYVLYQKSTSRLIPWFPAKKRV